MDLTKVFGVKDGHAKRCCPNPSEVIGSCPCKYPDASFNLVWKITKLNQTQALFTNGTHRLRRATTPPRIPLAATTSFIDFNSDAVKPRAAARARARASGSSPAAAAPAPSCPCPPPASRALGAGRAGPLSAGADLGKRKTGRGGVLGGGRSPQTGPSASLRDRRR